MLNKTESLTQISEIPMREEQQGHIQEIPDKKKRLIVILPLGGNDLYIVYSQRTSLIIKSRLHDHNSEISGNFTHKTQTQTFNLENSDKLYVCIYLFVRYSPHILQTAN